MTTERQLQIQSFESYTYIRFNAWRAKFVRTERGLVIQKLTNHWIPAAGGCWEWLDMVDHFCESTQQAQELFIAHLDAEKVFA